MTTRESLVFSLGRDSAHQEWHPMMTATERASYRSQSAMAEVLAERLRKARVERWLVECFGVGARTRKDRAQR